MNIKELIEEVNGYREELALLQEEQAVISDKSKKLMEAAQTVQRKIAAIIEEKQKQISNLPILH